jgi:hypothetical protein
VSNIDLISVGWALKSFGREVLLRVAQIRRKSVEAILNEWFDLLESTWLFANDETSITNAIQSVHYKYQSLVNEPQMIQESTPEVKIFCHKAAICF